MYIFSVLDKVLFRTTPASECSGHFVFPWLARFSSTYRLLVMKEGLNKQENLNKQLNRIQCSNFGNWPAGLQQIAEILQQKSLISKTTVDLNTKLCGSLKRELCKVWFCCSGCLLQDFCNLLYPLLES